MTIAHEKNATLEHEVLALKMEREKLLERSGELQERLASIQAVAGPSTSVTPIPSNVADPNGNSISADSD